MPQAPLPPDEILAREARTRKPAAYAALASALLVVAAMIVEYTLSQANIPDFDATDLVQTLSAVQNGSPFPRSLLTAIAEFQLDHTTENLAIAILRGVSIVALLPMTLLLVRAVRERGGQLGAWVAPVAIIGYVIVGLSTFAVFGILQPDVYRTARDAGLRPGDIWDAVNTSSSSSVQILLFVGSVLAGLTTSLTAIQAIRAGLLPRVIGYIGVLIGMLFVFPLDQSNIFRAFWFGALAFIVSGRLPNGTPPAWEAGKVVAPEPRQPAAPREPAPKGKKGKRAEKSS